MTYRYKKTVYQPRPRKKYIPKDKLITMLESVCQILANEGILDSASQEVQDYWRDSAANKVAAAMAAQNALTEQQKRKDALDKLTAEEKKLLGI